MMESLRQKWAHTGLLAAVRPEDQDYVVECLEDAARRALSTKDGSEVEKEIVRLRQFGYFSNNQ